MRVCGVSCCVVRLEKMRLPLLLVCLFTIAQTHKQQQSQHKVMPQVITQQLKLVEMAFLVKNITLLTWLELELELKLELVLDL